MAVPLDISPAEEVRLADAQKIFRGLVGEMRAFANGICGDVQFPLIRTNGLPVVYAGGILQHAGNVISFGIMGISEIARSLP